MQIEPRILENDIVRLEPLLEAHREVLRPLAAETELWALTSIRGDGEHFDAWFDLMLTGQARGDQISHLVRDAKTGEPLGHSAYLVITPAHKRLEIGWTWYCAEARGTRVNPACKRLLLGNAFDAGAERVELKTHHKNLRSQNAMLKMGATREGTLRRNLLCWTGEWRDSVYFSILRDEWPAARAGLDARLAA
ncbi:GNAT family protein [uncultured Maricaulis sp.]|uniref:GNAT family N-acetyltransferase n=1 Tax=uncultured Maricaulis sp. TaxID=174710 RepID=UPI0030D8570C|tara:strand:- start:13803 stop:14381 length:579 start_codon:yes stop_codon:yes gene_type:complete